MFEMRRSRNLTQGLVDFCEAIPANNRDLLVEIGAWIGEGAKIFSRHFDRVICVDPWSMKLDQEKYGVTINEVYGEFIKATKELPNVSHLRCRSLNATKAFPDKSIDVVYIDALHEYENVIADIRAWLPKVKEGGFMCGHDHCEMFPGVAQAVREMFPDKTPRLFIDGSWMIAL